MKVVVTGATGQLGYDIVKECEKRNIQVLGTGSKELNITDMEQARKVITDFHADTVIHCGAYTAVDGAEDEEALCREINVDGTRNIAWICRDLDIPLMYFSTDYVFDGTGTRPWKEEDQTAPLNVYGKSKYEGELCVRELLHKYFIVRISWVFGENGNNFIKTMLRLGREHGAVSVVEDQVGSPTYTVDLARLAVDMILTDRYGVYHATNEGECSWYEFAKEIFSAAGMDVDMTPVSSGQFPVRAKRPKNSRMSKDKLEEQGFLRLPDWKDAVGRYVGEIKGKRKR